MAQLDALIETAWTGWSERPKEMKALDEAREKNPTWFQSEKVVNGVLYVDRFAGNLKNLQDQIPYFYASVELADGGRCVLRYDLMPQWADKGMRDALPNPQDLFVWKALVALVLVVALIALRAGRVIMRKMEPNVSRLLILSTFFI